MRIKVQYSYGDGKVVKDQIDSENILEIRVSCWESDRWGLEFKTRHKTFYSCHTVKSRERAILLCDLIAMITGADILPENED